MKKSMAQVITYQQALLKYGKNYGVGRASRKYNRSRSYICFWKSRRGGTKQSLGAALTTAPASTCPRS